MLSENVIALLRSPLKREKKRTKKKKALSARRFIAQGLNIESFFSALSASRVRYVCLRWHEDLPDLAAGEDIDILIADEDLPFVEGLLSSVPSGGAPIDIYTVSGLKGTDYCGVPYFPPKLANFALDQPLEYKFLYKIPRPEAYFYTMAFHAVYHKGLRSGLRETIDVPNSLTADHDYAGSIVRYAQEAGLPKPICTLEDLDEILQKAGWRPGSDSLRKYARKNEWLARHLESLNFQIDPELNGLVTFLVRELAIDQIAKIRFLMQREGFEILETITIDPDDIDRIAANIRGGNWNQGPWTVSGGRPVIAIAAIDVFPDMQAREYYGSVPVNTRIARGKEAIRAALMRNVPKAQRFNPLHSSDTPVEALEYLNLINSDLVEYISRRAKSITVRQQHPYPVIRSLDGHRKRAKVEVIDFRGSLAVCKTFRAHALRFMEREILARDIAPNNPMIPKLIEIGPNYLVMEKFDHDETLLSRLRPFGEETRLLPVAVIRDCARAIREFRSQGYELIDLAPHNIILDRGAGAKLIDFEFLQEGSRKTTTVADSYSLSGTPEGFNGDIPLGKDRRHLFYYEVWFKRTGIPRVALSYLDNVLALKAIQLLGFVYLSAANYSARRKSALDVLTAVARRVARASHKLRSR